MIYEAIYRYRDEAGLETTSVTFEAVTLREAKITAKNMEGEDNKTWLINLFKRPLLDNNLDNNNKEATS